MIAGSLLIVGLFLALVIAQGQYAQSPASSAKGCGIPIVVNTVPVPDASRFAGRWYKYRHSGVNTTNQFLDHVPLNRSGIPFSTISATGMILRIEQYNNPNDVECVHRFLVSLYGINGQCPGKGLSSVDGYAPAASDLNILYLDIDTFYLVFICRGPNYKTGMCDKPAFHVLTRNRPDKMTTDQLQAIDNIVDAALAPFCFSSADVQQQMFTDNKPFCTPTEYAAAGCALKSVTALMQDIGNSTSN